MIRSRLLHAHFIVGIAGLALAGLASSPDTAPFAMVSLAIWLLVEP